MKLKNGAKYEANDGLKIGLKMGIEIWPKDGSRIGANRGGKKGVIAMLRNPRPYYGFWRAKRAGRGHKDELNE